MCCDPKNPKTAAKLSVRLSFGLALLLVGIAHYMTVGAFSEMAGEGLGALTLLGVAWAYILPGLMIVGGALFAVGMYQDVAAWASGLALGSIPVGMLLKPVLSGVDLPSVMPAVINAFVWLIVYAWVVKFCACSGGCSTNQ